MCHKGTESREDREDCYKCSVGTASNEDQVEFCPICPIGHYADEIGEILKGDNPFF